VLPRAQRDVSKSDSAFRRSSLPARTRQRADTSWPPENLHSSMRPALPPADTQSRKSARGGENTIKACVFLRSCPTTRVNQAKKRSAVKALFLPQNPLPL